MQDIRKLDIWKKSLELNKEIYLISGLFPNEEIYGLTSQLRRAAVSIPANIAEGCGRTTSRDFANFISIAIGSLCEVETYIEIALDLEYIQKEKYAVIIEKIDHIKRMLINFKTKLLKNV